MIPARYVCFRRHRARINALEPPHHPEIQHGVVHDYRERAKRQTIFLAFARLTYLHRSLVKLSGRNSRYSAPIPLGLVRVEMRMQRYATSELMAWHVAYFFEEPLHELDATGVAISETDRSALRFRAFAPIESATDVEKVLLRDCLDLTHGLVEMRPASCAFVGEPRLPAPLDRLYRPVAFGQLASMLG